MPGLDGTGPRGMGPMTGGRRGLCVPAQQMNNLPTNNTPPQQTPAAMPFYARGLGSGLGWRCGSGRRGGRNQGGIRGRGRW